MAIEAPDDLGAAGAALWEEVTAVYELDPAELVLLVEAARLCDELARLSDAAAGVALVVDGSTGQPRAHPLLDELRKHRATLAAMVGALRLPVDDERAGRSSASVRGQVAARARWAPTAVERAERRGRGAAS